MRDHISASQITTYLSCSLKYHFRYVEELMPESLSAALAFGKAMHAVLATFHESVRDNAPLSLPDLQKLWRADFLAETTEPLRYAGRETPESLLEMGHALIAAYFQLDHFMVESAEQSFRVPLCDPDTGKLLADKPLYGIYDLLVPNGIVEFKTAKSAMTEAILKRNLQLSAYAYSYEYEYGRLPEIRVIYLMKLKTPRVETVNVTRSRKDLLFFLRCADVVSTGIELGIFAPNPSWQCMNCEYGHACRDWPKQKESADKSAHCTLYTEHVAQ